MLKMPFFSKGKDYKSLACAFLMTTSNVEKRESLQYMVQ
jgi:hypothetical protein